MPKLLGQHFLKNPALAKKIVAAVEPKPGEMIIEIGPGHGALTEILAESCAKAGADLIAVEKDSNLALETEHRQIKVLHDDALLVFKKPQSHPEIFRPPYKIAGNIPYYITGHLLRGIGELETKPERCVFMVQKEVAERICAKPPEMNRLAASVQFWADPAVIARVPREDFSPAPKVDSAVILLETKRSQPDAADKYYLSMRALFAQPRKTIANNLTSQGASKTEIIKLLASLDIKPTLRPQDLTIENIRAIAALFS